MRIIEDALERQVAVPVHPARIVSLVPSVTELLFDLGVGPRVVGVSRYCVLDGQGDGARERALDGVARVGGQKDPDRGAIADLAPDLVIAVKEENLARDVQALGGMGLSVYVADVRTVEDAVALVLEVCDLVDGDAAPADAVLTEIRAGVAEARAIAAAAPGPPLRLFCPVWRDPYITISPDTYMFDLLRLCGAEPVTGHRRHDPTRGRYPKTRLDDVRAASPRLVLLPDEPYPFSERDVADLADLLPGVPAVVVDGKQLAWYGRRLASAPAIAKRIAEARQSTESA